MKHLRPGDKAPNFEVLDEKGQMRTLSDYAGKRLIIFFYPKDDTPSCTKEACSLRDRYDELKAEGFELLGISPDPPKKHQKFIDKYNLPYPLGADTELKMLNDYGVWGPKKFMGREVIGVHRTTFIIGPDLRIEYIIDKVITKDHGAQILQEVEMVK